MTTPEALARDAAVRSLERGAEYAYDHDGETPPPPAKDWAHAAARGVLWDLSDRRGIKQALGAVDHEVRIEMIESLAEIIRQSTKGWPR